MSAREDIEERAARFLLRQEEPGWSGQDQAALDAWLDADAGHQAAYWRLEHGWGKADRLAALRSPGAPARPAAPLRRLWRPAAIAASIAAVLAVGAALTLDATPRRTFTTELGGHQTVPLPDGTRLELNTDTRLRSEVTKTARTAWLDRGEAYFEVAHDPSRPFTIFAGPRKITVLGTKFSIRRDGERVKVSVVEGRVRVDILHPPKPIAPAVLTRGEIAIAQGPSTLVTPTSVQQVAGELSWRQGMLTLDHYTLDRAAAEFNRYNRKKIVIASADVGAVRIGGIFEADNVDGFIELLQQGYGLKVENVEGGVRISN